MKSAMNHDGDRLTPEVRHKRKNFKHLSFEINRYDGSHQTSYLDTESPEHKPTVRTARHVSVFANLRNQSR